MRCHVCNAEVGEGQRFCHECGESLVGVTDATQELQRLPAADVDLATTQPIDEIEPGGDAGATAPSATDLDEPGLPETQEVPAAAAEPELLPSELPPTELPPTEEVPAAELPDHAGEPLAPPMIATAHDGPIGASLFDPETAPPDAEPEWGEPITPVAEETFLPTDDPTVTTQQPVVYDVESDRAPHPLLDGEIQPFRLRPAFVFAFLGMITMLMASIADLTDIRTNRPVDGIPNRLSTIDDLGTNLAIAGFVGAACLLIGGLLQCFHLRWGAGMAGGAGLAIVGWAGLTIGLAEVPIDSAERITLDPNTQVRFTLTVTRDLGYWLVVAMAGIGLVVFLLSLTSAGTGGRRGLDPWSAALGAVGALVVAAGPLITVGGADFGVNFGTDNLPTAFFAGRLAQLALVGVTGVVGFLLVRSYGLGLVGGGVSVSIWLWLSSLVEIGDRPLGIAAGNLGSSDTTPHAVTTVGVVVTVLMLVVAATIAIVRSRKRPA